MNFEKFFAVFSTIMFGLEASLFGFNLADNNHQDAIVNGVLAVFWFIILMFVVLRAISQADVNKTIEKMIKKLITTITVEGINREGNNSKAVKKTGQSTRTATTTKAQKVSSTKKGVQNGRQKKQV